MAKEPEKTAPAATAQQEVAPVNAGRVSSPASTGGAGTIFEQHVGAYWLAQLLVRGIPPILRDCTVAEVHLQTERLGWHTDDFLVIGQNGSGESRKLAGQVKLTFTVSAADGECRKAVQDFWKDLKDPERFSRDTDRFALVTRRGTNVLLGDFSSLLDCARAARDGHEFEHRLRTSGFISAKAADYCDQIQTIIGELESKSVSAAEVWPLLRVLHVLSLDLNTETGQTEAWIKTLLAYTAGDHDALSAAEASWNALLCKIGAGMPDARSFCRDDLPNTLRQRHSPLAGAEQRVLRALSDHSAPILNGIRSTIGESLHLSRGQLVQQVLEQLQSNQVVLVSGPAGVGKSGVAKDAISVLAHDYFAFSFRAMEFAHPHFDATLQNSQIPARAETLGAILAGHDRKVLLIEGGELLLEQSTAHAFLDLLTLLSRDKSWHLLLTCRDYSVDLIRRCFLRSATLGRSTVTVTPFDEGELEQVKSSYPTLIRPLSDPTLRQLLRNPYVLDRSLQIDWSDERPLPQSEREFRALFWQEIIRADHRAAHGMPRRREHVFVQVALRRAQTLSQYTSSDGLDETVIDALRHDSLILASPQSNELVAPAHDVLEDWAILHWIQEQYASHSGDLQALSLKLGAYSAVGRTYRKWVTELVEEDPKAADALFHAAVRDSGLPAHFRDNTLVSLLRSASSIAFLERHSAELFADNRRILRWVIRLLRVACVTTPGWLQELGGQAPSVNVPEGPAWASVLQLVQGQIASFAEKDHSLLLGFIEDWARGVSWQTPYPDGAESVAAIAHWLLPSFDDYRSDDQRKRTLQVIAKIPNADRERFAALLQGSRDDEERDRVAEEFREIIFNGLEGMAAARDMPDALVSAAKDYLLCSEADLSQDWGYTSDLELETLFGIKQGRSHDFFPASAYRGPFLPLLRYHPREGLAFVIDVFNHSADWYAHPRVRSQYVEQPFEITLTFADGTTRKQCCNDRLWNLYRGTSVGPYVLQSLLMALELCLLEVGEAYPRQLDGLLISILKRSDSAALTAVVASVATAFPQKAGEALLVLLRSRECILLDKQRLVHESQAPSGLSGIMPRLDAGNKVYEEERKQADARAHRRYDLETAIANLQFGPFAARVHEILDRHRAVMPPSEKQDEHDRIWRLALHRMDLRQYKVADNAAGTPSPNHDDNSAENGSQFVRLELKDPEPDVKEMLDESAPAFQAMNARISLLMWGLKVFAREEASTYDPAQWQQRLAEARSTPILDGSGEERDLGRDGPGIVAAVCVRDRWDEMSADERDWCVHMVCSEVERDSDNWNHLARVQRNTMSADRACAQVLPMLLGKTLAKGRRSRVRKLFVLALTHPVGEVRWYAVWGIASYLWVVDRELTLRCVNTLAAEATLVQEAFDAESQRPFKKRRQLDELEAAAVARVRRRFFRRGAIADTACQAMDPTRWFGAEANGRILAMLGQMPSEPLTIMAFQRAAHTLVEWWDADDDRRGSGHARQERSFDTESALSDLLQDFLLRTSSATATVILQPILGAVDRHPREVHWLLQRLISTEDRRPNTTQFWAIWELFAESVRRAKWLTRIDDEYANGSEMMSTIFLGSYWKDDVRHWRSLEGHAHRIHALFESLPACSAVLDRYVQFLYQIGEHSLPEAFIRIAKHLQQGDPEQMMRKANTIFMLEALLQRYVYGRPLELKQQGELREAVLSLLDVLVEQGSSAAFRMRDDFVTPMSNA